MAVTLLSGLGSMSRAGRRMSGVMTVGRPPTRPRARAAARPSRVPETMSSRMNSARAGKPAAGGGGVEVLVQRGEPDVAAAQLAHGGNQVGKGPGEPVEAGNDEGVA